MMGTHATRRKKTQASEERSQKKASLGFFKRREAQRTNRASPKQDMRNPGIQLQQRGTRKTEPLVMTGTRIDQANRSVLNACNRGKQDRNRSRKG